MRIDVWRLGIVTMVGLVALGAWWSFVAKIAPANIDPRAGSVGLPYGAYNQQLWWIPVQSRGEGAVRLLETIVYRPAGAGPFALVVIYHGKPARNFKAVRPGFEIAAQWFVDHGFAVAVPLRQGYGRSQGTVHDMVGTCETMDYLATARATAGDAEGVISFMQRQSFIDPGSVIIVGHSHGGLGALGVASDAPNGVVGVINFAGGSGSWKHGHFCNGRDKLISAISRLGSENRLPQIWLYGLDDETFDPSLAREMWSAYTTNSRAKIIFVALPGTGEGHMLFPKGNTSVWGSAVQQFLVQLGVLAVVSRPGAAD
ncbi:dienelactone hydrolase [Bradyrhizobium sp. USDA 326]|uniref:alpha/beta hydrolase family protein n=1 Tax=unclassified Bradyrhizobium TaxID=2631580 RepID=UPI0035194B7C